MKFRVKFTLCMIGLMSVLFGIGGSLLLNVSFDRAVDREREELYSVYQMVSGTLRVIGEINGSLTCEDISDTIFKTTGQDEGLWEMIRFREDGERLIYEDGDTSLTVSGQMPEKGTCDIRRQTQGERELLFLSGALLTDAGKVRLDMARDVTELYEERQGWHRIYQGVFILMAILCALMSYSTALLLTGNLEKLSGTVRKIADGDLSSRADTGSGDEFGQLGMDFNRMADHLEETIRGLNDEVERQERFIGDFSHELKTPMTSIIGYGERGIALDVRTEQGELLLEPDLVYCLLRNLVENAANAMPDTGGDIRITERIRDGKCFVFVRDNGRGIPEDSLAHLTEAFYRVDRSRSRRAGGAGLGLSLCREIAEAHGGCIRFKSRLGKGTVVMAVLKGERNEQPG